MLSRKLRLSWGKFMGSFGERITTTYKKGNKDTKITYYEPALNRKPMKFLAMEGV